MQFRLVVADAAVERDRLLILVIMVGPAILREEIYLAKERQRDSFVVHTSSLSKKTAMTLYDVN